MWLPVCRLWDTAVTCQKPGPAVVARHLDAQVGGGRALRVLVHRDRQIEKSLGDRRPPSRRDW